MDNYKYHEAATDSVLRQALVPLLLVFILIPATFFIPELDSTRAPYPDLDPGFSQAALLLSDSAGVLGATIVGFILIAVMATRPRMSSSYRLKEALALSALAILFAGGGSWINEHKVKEAIKQPRPNIEWLAQHDGGGPLAKTSEEFYALGSKLVRRNYLAPVLESSRLPLSLDVKNHWLAETGYSLPSGHSFSAFFFATFFLCLACTFVVSKRRLYFYLLLPWALLVCYSRLILRVHTPADITLGGGLGILAGVCAWLLARTIIRQLVLKERDA